MALADGLSKRELCYLLAQLCMAAFAIFMIISIIVGCICQSIWERVASLKWTEYMKWNKGAKEKRNRRKPKKKRA